MNVIAQNINLDDLAFVSFLGAILFGVFVTLIILHFREKKKCDFGTRKRTRST